MQTSQTPVATGCPAGWDLSSVSSFPVPPYVAPPNVDSGGNDNGYVCAQSHPDSVRDAYCRQGFPVACALKEAGLPIYSFIDDDNQASKHAQTGG